MDVQAVVNLISTVGFPIVACIYLATTLNKSMQNLSDSINNMEKTMSEMSASDRELKDFLKEAHNGK